MLNNNCSLKEEKIYLKHEVESSIETYKIKKKDYKKNIQKLI